MNRCVEKNTKPVVIEIDDISYEMTKCVLPNDGRDRGAGVERNREKVQESKDFEEAGEEQ